jgi:predicted transcriptional regulator
MKRAGSKDPPRPFVLSIQKKFAERIASGTKKVEFRKRYRGGAEDWIFIYSSKGERALIGASKIAHIERGSVTTLWRKYGKAGGGSKQEFDKYYADHDDGVAIVLFRMHRIRPVTLDCLRRVYEFEPGVSHARATKKMLRLLPKSAKSRT